MNAQYFFTNGEAYFDEETFLGSIGETISTVVSYIPRIVPEEEKESPPETLFLSMNVRGVFGEYLPGVVGFYVKELYTAERFLSSEIAIVKGVREIFQEDLETIKNTIGSGSGVVMVKLSAISERINRLTNKYLKLVEVHLSDF
jgi:hypothetical protein